MPPKKKKGKGKKKKKKDGMMRKAIFREVLGLHLAGSKTIRLPFFFLHREDRTDDWG